MTERIAGPPDQRRAGQEESRVGQAGQALGRLGPRSARRLTNAQAYVFSAYVVGLCLFASVVPSPLYRIYSADWHLSPLTITLVFAVYAVGVLVALLLLGRVSDQVGRRPVLLASICALGLSSVLFIVADGVAWLYAARALQGLATGAAMSAASAALLDLQQRRDPVRVGFTNGVASTLGLGLGSLTSALIVAGGVGVRELPYVMLLVLYALGLVCAILMPEPVRRRERLDLRLQRPSVPGAIRHRFLIASLAVMAAWSLGGLFFALGTSLATELLDTRNVVATTFGAFGIGIPAAMAQVATRRLSPTWGAVYGGLSLAVGAGLVVVATVSGSAAAFVIGVTLTGIGFGVAFTGGLRNLAAVIPPTHRGAVMSAFYIVGYLSLCVPAVVAGILLPHLGLDHTFTIFGSLTGVAALLVAVEAYRTRPRPDRAPVAS